MFGDAVNRACKMGEDIGNAGEILITKEAMNLIPKDAEIESKPIQVHIGGANMDAFQILYRKENIEENNTESKRT
jgi:hypothetical protein